MKSSRPHPHAPRPSLQPPRSRWWLVRIAVCTCRWVMLWSTRPNETIAVNRTDSPAHAEWRHGR